jgi:hypothetical protein
MAVLNILIDKTFEKYNSERVLHLYVNVSRNFYPKELFALKSGFFNRASLEFFPIFYHYHVK